MIKKYYLAHPFSSRFKMREWELEIEKELDIEIINPFFDVEREDKKVILDNGATLTTLSTRKDRYGSTDEGCKTIVERDVNLIKSSDGVIVLIDGSISYGTIQEMVYAKLYDKRVIAIISNGHKGHPWLRYHSDEIFDNLDDAKEFLINL
jgi:nucleoside 2-deoxyribosyltransferase